MCNLLLFFKQIPLYSTELETEANISQLFAWVMKHNTKVLISKAQFCDIQRIQFHKTWLCDNDE